MNNRLPVLLGLISFSILLLAGCSGDTEEGSDVDSVSAGEAQLPDEITMSAYDVGSLGYTQVSAISDAIMSEYGTQIHMIPNDSGLARLEPLKEDTADFGGRLGDETYFAFEGTEEFAFPEWGPQDIRIMAPIMTHYGLLVLDDSEFESISDLEDARVPHVIGNPSVNVKNEALLAAAGLTMDDVEVVEVTSYGDQPEMIAQGEIDVAGMLTSAASVTEADELHGMRWLDHSILENDESLAALNDIYPFGVPDETDIGGALTEGEPEEFLGYTSYAPAAYSNIEADFVYNWLVALDETFDDYNEATADMYVWEVDEMQPEPLGVPIHEGGVRFFEEKGMWNEEYEEKNNQLIERQEQLQEAWDVVSEEAEEQGLTDDEFSEYWLERKEELVDDVE
ncbi:TAXI family TRAP transporter solute-binding subunit [Salicibibacter halophilus]|uniref:TAXI family TRAP transporter solute-binding subunit n=1 Tax=Salicibibacter halophilus TaxID=2502791 RepID=A0A514LFM9_9BACI|nr:TAXI family TRAP transporter solute-binding subunit [Salicibibacter halophilus]QDI90345.1 TAXI family TRAP transporter solute-binding subunit [Salicibibacter halophilus]